MSAVLPIFLKAFLAEHRALTLQDITFFQDFENIRFDDIALAVIPSPDEADTFGGSLKVYNLTFAARLKMYSPDNEEYQPS